MFSASQKRFWAKGRSLLTVRITVPGSWAARASKALAEAAQVPVSRLCTMLKTFFLPAKSLSDTSTRSPRVSRKSGARAPTLGSLPLVRTLFPLKRTSAMSSSWTVR